MTLSRSFLHESSGTRVPSFQYVLLLSVLIHLFFLSFITLPYLFDPERMDEIQDSVHNNALKELMVRDIIVNINPDGTVVETEKTMLSDVDSSAQGHLTEEKGDTWLNNSQTFSQSAASSGASGGTPPRSRQEELLLSSTRVEYTLQLFDETEYITQPAEKPQEEVKQETAQDTAGKEEETQPQSQSKSQWTRIPDKKGVTLENAIYYSNNKRFSFNTKKFSDFEYFRRMKQKIANNWFPPIMANSLSAGHTPGRTSVRVIANQEVRLYFVMNRNGDVKKVELVDSRGNAHLDESCLDAIRNSKTFGPVPDDIPGKEIVIPFIFGYYVR